jgi:outer membrane protein OmpA-like peptidoglycan-associated protein
MSGSRSGLIGLWVLVASVCAAQAQESGLVVDLRVSGTTFARAAPIFILAADGEAVLIGTVGAAYDLEAEGTMEITPDLLQAHAQSFSAELPGDDPAELSVTFANDAYGGEERPELDRDLYLFSMSINGVPVEFDRLLPDSGARVIDGGILAITERRTLRIPRPSSGWTGSPEHPDASQDEEPPDGPPQPSGSVAQCSADVLEVTGFEINSADIPAEMRDAVVRLGGELEAGSCAVTVTGYSSTDGPVRWNEILAEQRAQAVVELLAEAGLPRDRVGVEVKPQTRDFGASRQNRRVVIRPANSR